jgi:regulatory protein
MAKRGPIESLEEAYDLAVRMLTRRARTSAEVRAQLLHEGGRPDDVESVLGRLKAHRHLDDAVLASDEAFRLLEAKALAPALAVYSLTERGIDGATAQESVESVREGRSEVDLCVRALSLRLKGRQLKVEAAPKEGRALARLGYEEDVVTRTLERALRGSGE